MDAPGAGALMRDRLASHAAASCSHASGSARPPCSSRSARPSRCGTQRSVAAAALAQLCSAASQSSRCCWGGGQCLDAELGLPGRRRSRLGSTLRQADYAVYKELPGEQITEAFLWGRLRPLLGYLNPEDVEKVREALSLATDAHAGQLRKSGEPFITHPVEVARLLAELRMDKESLIAGLLHDTVEDNPAQITFEEIGVWFGQAVRTIVEGETKFSKVGALGSGGGGGGGSSADVKAQDLQHLFLAMTKEVRIIVVKLADRLHNMRTLDSMPPHKQRKIAEETLQVFAPLARLLGLYSIKEELEALGFRYARPREHALLQRRLDQWAAEHAPAVAQAREALEQALRADEYLQQRVDCVTVTPTQKSVYSVFRKLQEAGRGLEADAVAGAAQLRVVIHPRAGQQAFLYGTGSQLCYHVMGLVHGRWAPVPGGIKDYIATPKRNGYQSLHTTVLPLGATPLLPLEVQIRTAKMQELAEFGIAGEKWAATDAQSGWEAPPPPPPPPAGAASEGALQRRRKAQAGVVGGLLRLLPRIVGLSGDASGGSARPSSNGASRPLNGNGAGLSLNGNGASSREASANGSRSPRAQQPPQQQQQQQQQPGPARLDSDVLRRREHWLRSIIEWQREFLGSLSAREFVDGITDDLLGRGVFVFTPRGDLMRLPKDSTAVDFAYHVHTDVGNQMVGAKVNGKLASPHTRLGCADVVEVLTYDGPPTRLSVARHAEWARHARSKTARHKLARFLRDNARLLPPHLRAAPGDGDGDALAAGEGAGGGGEAAAAAAGEKPPRRFWLHVEGSEAPGVLAELARIIARHGHDVQTYSGSADAASGTLRMRFEVLGRAGGCCKAMCAEIGAAPFVRAWQLVDPESGLPA